MIAATKCLGRHCKHLSSTALIHTNINFTFDFCSHHMSYRTLMRFSTCSGDIPKDWYLARSRTPTRVLLMTSRYVLVICSFRYLQIILLEIQIPPAGSTSSISHVKLTALLLSSHDYIPPLHDHSPKLVPVRLACLICLLRPK